MPDISASLALLDATFFLYPSVGAAERGESFGGSGVIVGVPLSSKPDLLVRYAVTNWHVACSGGASVIRLNLPGGGVHIIDKDPSEWVFIPGRQDLAAIVLLLPPDIQPPVVSSDLFITGGEKSDAHVGDDVFMVGRFLDFDGRETNKPAARFGSVSMMEAPIPQPTGFKGNSIIVDMHCRSGFSGSPVYVYRPGAITVLTEADFSGQGLPKLVGPKRSHRRWGIGNDVQVKLLGLLWGQFPEMWEIKSPEKGINASAELITEGAFVEGFSGMSCVVPATDILELLNVPALRVLREALDVVIPTAQLPITP